MKRVGYCAGLVLQGWLRLSDYWIGLLASGQAVVYAGFNYRTTCLGFWLPGQPLTGLCVSGFLLSILMDWERRQLVSTCRARTAIWLKKMSD